MAGKICIVGTPIGNLGDMTPRALDALRAADVVCAEDTRITGKLLAALGVPGKRLERLDEATLGTRAEAVVARAAAGEVIAFCSDAGMPGMSDPGARLVAAAHAAGVAVDVLPGPTAASCAYAASGFACPQFYFGGFFPRKAGEQRRVLESLAGLCAVLLFYESPNRVAAALAVVAEVFPHRQVAVCRELTKLHEEVWVGSASDAAREFARREAEEGIKGEIVLVIDAPPAAEVQDAAADAAQAAQARAAELAAEGTRSKKDITRQLQAEFNIPRNVAYNIVLEISGGTKVSEGESGLL